MKFFPLFLILIMLALGLVTWAFFRTNRIVKVRFNPARPGLLRWRFKSHNLTIAEARFGVDDDKTDLTTLWNGKTITCQGLATADQHVRSELGQLIELPSWAPSWLRRRILLHDEYLLLMKRGNYNRVVDLLFKHERSKG